MLAIERGMASHPPRAAGGCLLAAFILIGAGVGVAVHEASIGLLAGFGVGVVAAVLVAVWDARRA